MSEDKKETHAPKAGQWWGVSRWLDNLDAADRVRRLTESEGWDPELHDESTVLADLAADEYPGDAHAVYLGDGEQPIRTPWMNAQLARVASAHDGAADDRLAADGWYAAIVNLALGTDGPAVSRLLTVRAVYRLLRSLGYA